MIIKESTNEITNWIHRECAEQFYKKLVEKAPQIKEQIRNENLQIWKNSDTYHSLLYGDLNHEFGFEEGTAEQKVNTILNYFSKSLYVVAKRPLRRKQGVYVSMEIKVFKKAFSLMSIFNSEAARIPTGKDEYVFDNDGELFSQTRKFLYWLEWLLKRGNEIIIYDHRYEDIVSERSRSGKGLMIFDEASYWKVPAKYSGTRDSNWLTRELEKMAPYLKAKYFQIIVNNL